MTSPLTAAPPETVDDDPPITQLMSSRIVGITPDSPLATALRLMARTGARHLPVLRAGRCLGIVTEGEIARFVTGGLHSFSARAAVPVEELTWPTEPLPTTARRSDAARRMRIERSDAVLVVHDGRLVGLVTATDLIRSLAGERPARPHGEAPS
jgi:CBS domain-containing protein